MELINKKQKVKKERLDVLVTNLGLAKSRTEAQNLIREGKIFVNNQKEDKPGTTIKEDSLVELRGEKQKYVSRGGYKLEKAINIWNLDLNGKVCMDVGSSTGGFTDCMLQNGARKVYSIDVGTGQLDWSLRNNEKVVVLEQTNARYIDKETVNNDKIDFVSMDVSFISITKILPAIYSIIDEDTVFISLLKPQFEAEKEEVEKGGIIKDKKIHEKIISNVINYVRASKFDIINLDYSPIKGPSGNIEYLLYLKKSSCEGVAFNSSDDVGINRCVESVVEASHKELDV